jgi:ADP-ribose pyrophosphatase YjhB (NUDIX family)
MQLYQPRCITKTSFDHGHISSYGLIVYSLESQRCILVQRKHSVEFLIILTGQYRISQLGLLFDALTRDEYEMIQAILKNKINIREAYLTVGLNLKDMDYGYARLKQHEIEILEMSCSNRELLWTWPKGRNEEDEDYYVTAVREFKEEVEAGLPPPIFVSQQILMEMIKSMNNKIIETFCYLYIIQNEFELPMLNNHSEVADRKWYFIDDAFQLVNQIHMLPVIKQMIADLE